VTVSFLPFRFLYFWFFASFHVMLIGFRQARRWVANGPRSRAREALVVRAVAGRHVEVVAAVRRRGYGAESGGAAAAGEAADLGYGSGEYCVLIDLTHWIFFLIGFIPRVFFLVRFVMLWIEPFVWPCAGCEFLMSLHQLTFVTSVPSITPAPFARKSCRRGSPSPFLARLFYNLSRADVG
jgi:hypothetical protein